MMRRALAWVLVCAGCSTAPPILFGVRGPMAVGGTEELFASTCAPVMLVTDVGQCSLATLTSVTSSDPKVIEIGTDGGRFFAVARAAGVATLHAELTDKNGDHKSTDATAEAQVPDDVDLYWEWSGPCSLDAGVALPAADSAAVTYAPVAHGVMLAGDFPVEQLLSSDVLTVSGAGLIEGQLPHRVGLFTPDAGGRGTLRAPLVPGWSLPVDVFELPQASAVTLEPSSTGLRNRFSSGATHTSVRAMLIVDGLTVCRDRFARTVTSLTPSVCLPYLNPTPDAGPTLSITGPDLQLASGEPGRCTIQVSVDGTALTATQDYVVLLPDGGCPDGGAGVGPCN